MGVALSRRPRSSPVLKHVCSFHSVVLAMVDATRDAFDNIGTFLEDVAGTVVFLLVAVAKDVSARDALENNGNLHEDVDGKVIATRDAFNDIGTFFKDVDGSVTSTGMPSL